MLFKSTIDYPQDIRPLTSLRYFAAFWVVLFHFTTLLPAGGMRDWTWVTKGYLAVDFFFILSGFIICHVYGTAAKSGTLNTTAFYIRRLAKLYPLHLLTMALYIAGLSYLMIADPALMARPDMQKYGDDLSPTTILSHLFLVHGWGFERDLNLNTPSWSISAEWFAYLLFPLLAGKLLKLKPNMLLLTGFVTLMAFWFATPVMGLSQLTQLACDFSILRIVPEFLLGMGLYEWGRQHSLKGPIRLYFTATIIGLFIALTLNLPDIYIVLIFPVIIYMAAEAARKQTPGILNTRPLVYLGHISYAMYMIHFPVMEAMYVFVGIRLYDNNPPLDIFLLLWLSLFPLTIILAALAHRLIEMPVRRQTSGYLKSRA